MKTNYLKIAASVVLVTGLNISCDGCKDKKTTDSEQVNVSVETSGTTDTNATYDESSSANGSNASNNSETNKANATGTKAGKKPNGYSAADGSDAENHDGDMYTKHDTTPQASGPPIK